MSEFENDLLKVMIKHKVIDEVSLRNFRIRDRYLYLREVESKTGKAARTQLASEFNMSEKNIEHILYGKSR